MSIISIKIKLSSSFLYKIIFYNFLPAPDITNISTCSTWMYSVLQAQLAVWHIILPSVLGIVLGCTMSGIKKQGLTFWLKSLFLLSGGGAETRITKGEKRRIMQVEADHFFLCRDVPGLI